MVSHKANIVYCRPQGAGSSRFCSCSARALGDCRALLLPGAVCCLQELRQLLQEAAAEPAPEDPAAALETTHRAEFQVPGSRIGQSSR
jgi:hypothetical protein